MKVGNLTYDGTTYKLVEPTIGDLRAIGSVQATPRGLPSLAEEAQMTYVGPGSGRTPLRDAARLAAEHPDDVIHDRQGCGCDLAGMILVLFLAGCWILLSRRSDR